MPATDTLHMGKLNHEEEKYLAQGHTAGKALIDHGDDEEIDDDSLGKSPWFILLLEE